MIANVVRDILRNHLEIDDIQPKNICSFNIPKSLQNNVEENVILVTEVQDSFSDFAGDHATNKEQVVQIQIFYNDDANQIFFENTINRILEDYLFYCSFSSGHELDPDTQQLYITFEYKNKRKGMMKYGNDSRL